MLDGLRTRITLVIAVAGVVVAGATLDFHRDSPWTAALFAIAAAGVVVRCLPEDRVPLPARVATEAATVVAAGVLFALQPNGALGVLLYISTVHLGGAFPARISVPLAVLAGASVTATASLTGPTDFNAIWIGVSVTATVWAGIAGRSRRERTRALEQLVEQTKLTAESESRSSALAERARIARDLHDVLAHTLSGAGMQLELADALLEANRPDDARAAVQRARGAIADGVTEARGAVHALREDTVDLPATLAALADGPDETVETEPVELTAAQARAVLRVTQEAITNARRYAAGAPVVVRLSPVPDGAELTVTNGAGTATAVHGSGMGLIGMRERAAEAGGSLHAAPTGDGGWAVRLVLPRPSDPIKEL
ncbi:sensor histidine kinase [Tsukamurella sp. DT100]|uniref:sensor histidine kinase n=1 Tax=Tsukamurella sp. DT100 TaxID=3393415 RepID=UPI003CEC679D